MTSLDVLPLAVSEAWSLLSKDAVPTIEFGRWQAQARTFFDATIESSAVPNIVTAAASGVLSFELVFAWVCDPTMQTGVSIRSLPLEFAPSVVLAANEAVEAIGGAGMDVLVARATRLWQVAERPSYGSEMRAPLVVAAILASVLLAPIVPPDGRSIFGVKGARMRLDKLDGSKCVSC